MLGGGESEQAVNYSEAFKGKMVQQLTLPGAKSAGVLASEVGVPQATLSRWVREARRMRAVGMVENQTNGGQEKPMKRRPEDWSFKEKFRVLVETEALRGEELGAYLRREGLHESQLLEWRKAMEEALAGSRKTRKQKNAEARQIRKLEKELKRKEKALAEVAALLVLQKKAQALLGGEDEDT